MAKDKKSSGFPWVVVAIVAFLIIRRLIRSARALSGSSGISLGSAMGTLISNFLHATLVVALVLLGIAAVVGLILWIAHRGDRQVKKAKTPLMEGKTEKLLPVLSSYRGKFGIGGIAEAAVRQMSNLEKKTPILKQMIEEKFEVGSMSYDRFATPVENSIATVKGNSLTLAKELEGFDDEEFQKLSKAIQSGDYRHDVIDDEIQKERFAIYQHKLSEMERIISTNEQMLLMLDRISVELSKLQSNQIDREGSQLLQEIDELAKTAKYYQERL